MEKRRGFPPIYKIERVAKMSVKRAFFSIFQKIMVICGVMMVPLFGGGAHSAGVVFKRFTILCSVLLMIFATPAHADTMCNLYNKADGVLYGYPTADITWYARTNGENTELTIRMRLTEGKTYTAIRAVAGGTPAFRIQASPTETLTNGQSLVNINSAGNTNTKTFVVPTGAPYVLFYVRNTYGSSNTVTKDEVINGFMLVEGSTAPTEYIPYNTNCGVVPVVPEKPIKIATTAYNSARFNPVKTDLDSAVATIREIVTKTINQTAAIASLQADKQTRPEDACPAGKKCLLVETEENGVIVPHWFPIIEAPE